MRLPTKTKVHGTTGLMDISGGCKSGIVDLGETTTANYLASEMWSIRTSPQRALNTSTSKHFKGNSNCVSNYPYLRRYIKYFSAVALSTLIETNSSGISYPEKY